MNDNKVYTKNDVTGLTLKTSTKIFLLQNFYLSNFFCGHFTTYDMNIFNFLCPQYIFILKKVVSHTNA